MVFIFFDASKKMKKHKVSISTPNRFPKLNIFKVAETPDLLRCGANAEQRNHPTKRRATPKTSDNILLCKGPGDVEVPRNGGFRGASPEQPILPFVNPTNLLHPGSGSFYQNTMIKRVRLVSNRCSAGNHPLQARFKKCVGKPHLRTAHGI